MKTVKIPLTQGQVALVDAGDAPMLLKHKWCCNRKGYATAHKVINGKRTNIYMHRLILDVKNGGCVDHINRDRSDNRRCNLRLANYSQNNIHRSGHSNGTSKYKGVYLPTNRNRWIARVGYKGKTFHIASCKEEEDAAIYYNVAAQIFYGDFAILNPI